LEGGRVVTLQVKVVLPDKIWPELSSELQAAIIQLLAQLAGKLVRTQSQSNETKE
jgi:hypothetical protein